MENQKTMDIDIQQLTTLDRLKLEHKELTKKIDKLSNFVYSEGGLYDSLDRIQQNLLVMQLGFMMQYKEVLYSRIWSFNEPVKKHE